MNGCNKATLKSNQQSSDDDITATYIHHGGKSKGVDVTTDVVY